jgi:AcrR family transcriptional regulator
MGTQRRGEEIRALIQDAALEALARYGYHATSVSEVCRRTV